MTSFTDSQLWKEYIESGKEKPIEVVLHACNTSDFAKNISKDFKNMIITAPDEKLATEGDKEVGSYRYTSESLGVYFKKGYWNTFENGLQTNSTKTDSAKPILIENGREVPNDLPRKTNATQQNNN